MIKIYKHNKIFVLLFITTFLSFSKGYSQSNDNYYRSEYKKNMLFLLTGSAGLEVYHYYQKNDPLRESYSELKTDVEPIYLYSFNINCSLPFFFMKTIYKYKQSINGTIDDQERYEYINEHVDNPKIQYLLNVSAGLLGVELNYLYQNFTNGTYKYFRSDILPDDNTVLLKKERNLFVNKEYLTIEKKQLEMKYHFNWYNIPQLGGLKQSKYGLDYYFGYRYINNKTPEIIYTVTFDDELLKGESLPQIVNTYYHMIGLGINNSQKPIDQGFNFLIGSSFYIGYSYMKCNVNDYWFLPSAYDSNYKPEKDEKIHNIPINFNLVACLNYCLTNKYLITSINLEWNFDVYYRFGHFADNNGYIYRTGDTPCNIFQSLKLSFQSTF